MTSSLPKRRDKLWFLMTPASERGTVDGTIWPSHDGGGVVPRQQKLTERLVVVVHADHEGRASESLAAYSGLGVLAAGRVGAGGPTPILPVDVVPRHTGVGVPCVFFR
jgi:hypothetical protein